MAPAAPVLVGQPVLPQPPAFTAADLIGGNALIAPSVTDSAAEVLRTYDLDLFVRHFAHIEQTDRVGLTLLRDLGLTRGYSLINEPAHLVEYLTDMLFLDAMPEMTDPGQQGIMPDGTVLQPRALVHALRSVMTKARDLLEEARDAARAGMIRETGGIATGVATAVATALRDSDSKGGRTTARTMPAPEVNALKLAFRIRHDFCIADHELGDARSFGKAELYCRDQSTYPSKDAMDWLKVYSGDGHVPEGGKSLRSDGSSVTMESLDPTPIEAGNATAHVEAYTRKANTILLVIGGMDIKEGQSPGGSSAPGKQLGLDDVLQERESERPSLS